MKPCIKCGSTDRNKSGNCKVCARAATIAWKKENPEKIKIYAKSYHQKWYPLNAEKQKITAKKWYLENKERVLESQRVRRIENPEKIKECWASWYQRNTEKHKKHNSEYRKENSEKCKSYNDLYRKNNTEKIKSTQKIWRLNNQDTRKIHEHNRRARKIANGGTLSKGLVERLYKLQKGKCACCGKPLGDDYHLDHIMPLALGGANEDWNIQLLRQRCNNQKCAKHPIDFMQKERGLLL